MEPDVVKKIDEFFSAFPKRSYPKGQILVFADESPEYIFYIVSGKVRKYAMSYRGEEVIVNVFKHPAFFPMSWAINHTPNKYFYKTEEETVLRVVHADEALQFVKDNPDVALDLISRIYRGMDGLLGRVVHLMSGTAKSRLVYELIIEARRFGDTQPDGSIVLKTNESDLAARSGLTRETVSREMKKLKTNDWITLTGKSIIVHDIAALQKLLGTEI